MNTLFINIKELVQIRKSDVSVVSGVEMAELPTIKNAYLLISNDVISDFGTMDSVPKNNIDAIIDVKGKMIFPTWCDSHTHIVYAGNRIQEFADKINGLSYEEISNRGGGILNSAKLLNETSEEDLYNQAKERLQEVMQQGTGVIEIKSGYGLTVEGELKMLRVIKKLSYDFPIKIKATLLAAHTYPTEFKDNHQGYIDIITKELLPIVMKENLANFIDVFCENGYFSTEETNQIFEATRLFGLIPKLHVNQFNSINGIEVGVKHRAITVDHLEVLPDSDLETLKKSYTLPVALPLCSFYLGIPYTPARKIIDAGLPLALASDYNPGSSPSGNMSLVIANACIKMKMTPEEAINAATINGARALRLEFNYGSITIGKKACFFITKPMESYHQIAYNFGTNFVETVYLNGKKID